MGMESVISRSDGEKLARRQLTVTGLMACLSCRAAGFAALHAASALWYRLVYTTVDILMVLGTIAARYRGPFRFGFAVMG